MKKTKSKKKIVILCVVLAVVIALLAILGVRIIKGSSWAYTEEQHLQRISKLVEKRYMGEKSEYTSYEVFPLYDQNEKMKYCIVEFEPYGFVWVKINDNDFIFSMYSRGEMIKGEGWSRYKLANKVENYSDLKESDFIYEKDESGNIIYHKESPYKVGKVGEERRYLLTIKKSGDRHTVTIPAVKRDGKFIDLVSTDYEAIDDIFQANPGEYPSYFVGIIVKQDFNL